MTNNSWKKDFPVSRSEEHKSSRRQLFLFLCFSALVTGLFNIYRGLFQKKLTSFPKKELISVDQIKNGYYLFRYPTENDPAILVKLADGTLRAFSQRCTHLLCPVHFKPADDSLYCPCHNGSFDAKDGSVLFGPPPKPLPQYKVKIDNSVVWITGTI